MKISQIIVALDGFDSANSLLAFVRLTKETNVIYKIGKESFIKYGPALLQASALKDCRIFLDLKLNDIPNTVANSIEAIMDMGVWMTNIHCSGGIEMMEAAVKAVERRPDNRMLLIGVTVLTSLDDDDLRQMGYSNSAESVALNYAKLGYFSGLDGIVCSPLETNKIKQATDTDFLVVTPGIRPSNGIKDDQKRTQTPVEAMRMGSDYLVIGRPITKTEDPIAMISSIRETLAR
jgi:orotidine-5'-phosphate decarboxylase